MSTAIFRELAGYNRWANARIYAVAFELPEAQFKRPVGIFIESMHGTLNHLLTTDLIWLKRLRPNATLPIVWILSSTTIYESWRPIEKPRIGE